MVTRWPLGHARHIPTMSPGQRHPTGRALKPARDKHCTASPRLSALPPGVACGDAPQTAQAPFDPFGHKFRGQDSQKPRPTRYSIRHLPVRLRHPLFSAAPEGAWSADCQARSSHPFGGGNRPGPSREPRELTVGRDEAVTHPTPPVPAASFFSRRKHCAVSPHTAGKPTVKIW